MSDVEGALIIMTRVPEPGRVKTRLIPSLGESGAAALYRELMERTFATAQASRFNEVRLYCTPPSRDHAFCHNLGAGSGWTISEQRGAGLGERMRNAFETTLAGAGSAVMIGCDCPMLHAVDLDQARDALCSGYDAVLGPAEDGGYYLIGLKQMAPELFNEIAWGGPLVAAETRARIGQRQWQLHELPMRWDVDRPKDLARYRQSLGWARSAQRRV